MNDRGPARVMTLGRLGRGSAAVAPQLSPSWTTSFFPNPVTSPNVPQYLPRATLQNGPTAMGNNAMRVVEDVSIGNLGKVLRALGNDGEPAVSANGGGPAPTDRLYQRQMQMASARRTRGIDIGIEISPAVAVVSGVSAAASAYHGYRRNRSVGWAAWWGLMGLLFPIVTPAVGIAQGWGKRTR